MSTGAAAAAAIVTPAAPVRIRELRTNLSPARLSEQCDATSWSVDFSYVRAALGVNRDAMRGLVGQRVAEGARAVNEEES